MGIRRLQSGDLHPVADLYERMVRSGSAPAAPELVDAFSRFFFDGPGVREDCASFVYEDGDGKIVGFIGGHARDFLFDGNPIRVLVSGPLFVDSDSAVRGAGILLLGALRQQRHDLLLTDGANPLMQQIWGRLGGQTYDLACMHWNAVFRRWRFAVRNLSERPRLRRFRFLFAVAEPFCALADKLLHPIVTRHVPAHDDDLHEERLSPESMHAALIKISESLRLRPDYSVESLTWMLNELSAIQSVGELRTVLLRNAVSDAVGIYLYYQNRGGISDVIHVSAVPGSEDLVLGHLLRSADGAGSLALRGRLEPRLLVALNYLGCELDYGAPLTLVRAKDPALYSALFTGQALLTRFDGESWMGFPFERFGS